eukprot:186983-Alexandrium_andersonii.AAC.1
MAFRTLEVTPAAPLFGPARRQGWGPCANRRREAEIGREELLAPPPLVVEEGVFRKPFRHGD